MTFVVPPTLSRTPAGVEPAPVRHGIVKHGPRPLGQIIQGDMQAVPISARGDDQHASVVTVLRQGGTDAHLRSIVGGHSGDGPAGSMPTKRTTSRER